MGDIVQIGATSSPFIYHEGMYIVRDDESSNVSSKYVRECVYNGRLSERDVQVLKEIYLCGYINRHIIDSMMFDSELQSKRCLSKLVRNGFIIRMHCVYGTNFTPYFYTVSPGVSEYFRATQIKGQTVFPDATGAMRLLSRCQFRSAIRKSQQFRSDKEHTFIRFEKKHISVDVGYSAVIESAGKNICLCPVVVRRNPGWDKSARDIVKAALLYRDFETVIPICVCEDTVHMREMCLRVLSDEWLADQTILYCSDSCTSAGDVLSQLYEYSGELKDGIPIFTEISFRD